MLILMSHSYFERFVARLHDRRNSRHLFVRNRLRLPTSFNINLYFGALTLFDLHIASFKICESNSNEHLLPLCQNGIWNLNLLLFTLS